MLSAVMAELSKRKGRLPDVVAAVPGIDYSWLSKLVQGRIREPGVNKIQALYDYLFRVDRSGVAQGGRLAATDSGSVGGTVQHQAASEASQPADRVVAAVN